MKLTKALDSVNQIEKASLLKILDGISNKLRDNNSRIENLLSAQEGQLKNADSNNLSELFGLVCTEFEESVNEKLQYNTLQLDILFDIMIRDGNAIMSRDWFKNLYEEEISGLRDHLDVFLKSLSNDGSDIETARLRDYQIYKECVKTAYENDDKNNRDRVITQDENSILITLAKMLDLSAEEKRMLYYTSLPLIPIDIDESITTLKELGVVLYSRKNSKLFVPDEIVWMLRKLRGKELADKYFRRILRQCKDAEINRIARQHGIPSKLDRVEKIASIIKQGVSTRAVLSNDIFNPDTKSTDKKNYLQELIQKKLGIDLKRTGTTVDERISKLIEYYNEVEREENIGVSEGGFQALLEDLKDFFPTINDTVRSEFQLQQQAVLDVALLKEYNIAPLDILDLLSNENITAFRARFEIKTRGNSRITILDKYTDVDDLYIENYELIASRNITALKEKNLIIKEADLGNKFEAITRQIFGKLGLNIDETLRKQTNTARDKADIIINLGNNEVIVVECKTKKDSNFNNYSSVSRQLKAYERLCEDKGLKVVQTMLVSCEFTEGFIAECEYDAALNTSLLSADGLKVIATGYKNSSLKSFPIRLFMKGGKLHAERIVMAMSK